jgi:hypothetical protein
MISHGPEKRQLTGLTEVLAPFSAQHRSPARPQAPPGDTIVITGPSRPLSRRRQPTGPAPGSDPN